MVNQVLAEELAGKIHALAITALAPAEVRGYNSPPERSSREHIRSDAVFLFSRLADERLRA